MDNGKPYAPERFKQIIQERYIITKQTNTSYVDVGHITPLERRYILGYIEDELKKRAEALQQLHSKN